MPVFRRRKRKELTQSHLEEYLANRPTAPAPRPAAPPTPPPTPPPASRPAEPFEYSRPSETRTGSELERHLSICQECGTGLIHSWRAFPDESVRCDYHVPEPSTEAAFRIIMGWSEHDLLLRGYHVASTLCNGPPRSTYQPLLSEVERRLGLGPVQPGPSYESPKVSTVPQAMHLFEQHGAPWIPIIDERRLEAEYHSLQFAWGERHLSTGPLPEITDLLRRNLDRDATGANFSAIRVTQFPERYLLETLSYLAGNRAFSYRIWRTPTHYGLVSSRSDRPAQPR